MLEILEIILGHLSLINIIKNWKFNQILKMKDEIFGEFLEKSKKKEIIEKLDELVQLLKDEGASSKT